MRGGGGLGGRWLHQPPCERCVGGGGGGGQDGEVWGVDLARPPGQRGQGTRRPRDPLVF